MLGNRNRRIQWGGSEGVRGGEEVLRRHWPQRVGFLADGPRPRVGSSPARDGQDDDGAGLARPGQHPQLGKPPVFGAE